MRILILWDELKAFKSAIDRTSKEETKIYISGSINLVSVKDESSSSYVQRISWPTVQREALS